MRKVMSVIVSLFCMAMVLLPFFASSLRAEVPLIINYQGLLKDSLGEPVPDGLYSLSVTIYEDSSGSNEVWVCRDIKAQVANGLFSCLLGEACALPDDVFMDSSRWVGITIGEGTEMSPRIRIATVPYAFHARRADTALHVVSSGSSVWADDGTVVRLITAGDSVGIGTTTPTAKLDVTGDINTSETYQISGSTILSKDGNSCVFVGTGAGEFNAGTANTFIGGGAGANTSGNSNTIIGNSAGYNNNTGENNTIVGAVAGGSNTSGSRNTFIGRYAGNANTTEWHNTYIGNGAGSTAHGDTNTYLGASAGGLSSGSNNVFLGFMAGYNEDGSNKLYIANSGTSSPLIYGDFSTSRVGIGTTSPSAPLHVYNDAGTALRVEADGLMPSAIYGSTASTGGRGVYGRGEGSLGVGVYGSSAGATGKGVYGTASEDDSYGIYGVADGDDSYGVYGTSDGYMGSGVYGSGTGGSGIGVNGYGRKYGMYAEAFQEGGVGIKAYVGSNGGVGLEAHGGYNGYAAKFYGNVILLDRDDSTIILELGEGLDYAEGFDASDRTDIEPGTVMCIDPASPGKLTVSDETYDCKVAGIVAGAEGLGSGVRLGSGRFDIDVALAGRVYCKVDATSCAVKPGDMLTTSSKPGYAMKADDRSRSHGAVLGKAMEPLEKGQAGKILVLVTLQ